MNTPKHTPAPWHLGEYGEHLGYDCMTGGIRVGPVVLDGADYGQEHCMDIEPEALIRMQADAQLISVATELLAALQHIVARIEYYSSQKDDERPNIEQWEYTEGSTEMANARAAITKATESKP